MLELQPLAPPLPLEWVDKGVFGVLGVRGGGGGKEKPADDEDK